MFWVLLCCTADFCSVSSTASLLVIPDLPIKLSTLFMAVITALSSASCLFLESSIAHYLSTLNMNSVDSSEFADHQNK